MGTSNSYGGPTGGNPLLPAWAQQSSQPVPDQNAPEPANGEDENDNGSQQTDSNSPTPAGEDNPPLTLTATATRRTSQGPTSSHWSSAKGNMTRFAGGGGRRNLSNAGRAY